VSPVLYGITHSWAALQVLVLTVCDASDITSTMFSNGGTHTHPCVVCRMLLLCCPAAMLAVADGHVRELFRRHCYTNFTRFIGRSMCVSDEHYLPSLMASYGLDDATDCKVRAILGCVRDCRARKLQRQCSKCSTHMSSWS
jgi:hypothetical protein